MKTVIIALTIDKKDGTLVGHPHAILKGVEFVNEAEARALLIDYKRENPKEKQPQNVILVQSISL